MDDFISFAGIDVGDGVLRQSLDVTVERHKRKMMVMDGGAGLIGGNDILRRLRLSKSAEFVDAFAHEGEDGGDILKRRSGGLTGEDSTDGARGHAGAVCDFLVGEPVLFLELVQSVFKSMSFWMLRFVFASIF